jgi:hypothetical protein
MLGGFTKNTVDLSIVDIKNKEYDDRESCFVGTGIPGCQIAKKLSEEYYCIDNRDSKTIFNVINQAGESSALINQTLSHFQNQVLVIISGSMGDPAFLSLRKRVLSNAPMFLWTILESQKNSIEHPVSIQPQINESITVIPPGADYIKQSLVLIQTLIHYLIEPGLVAIFWEDMMKMFAGRWTKTMDVETNNQSYRKDIQRFIMHNITHLQHAGSASLIIFAGPSLTNSVLNIITNLFNDSMPPDSILAYSAYIVEEFDSKLHVAIIMDDKFIRNHNN